jgi:dephospho-CoA kinase
MKLAVITGMPGSGKEEFLNVAAGRGMQFIRMGDIVREFHSRYDGNMSIGEFAGNERKKHGYDIWAKRSIERLNGNAVIDGCRNTEEIDAFRGLAEVIVVAIHSPPQMRYERLVARGRSDAPSDIREFQERDEREIGWGIAKVIILSDAMIVNDADLEKFRDASRRVLDGLL